ncbi:MAG: CAAX protease [Clostridiales bacterium]|nr:CAAX protease [Clostridiales bacterium]
MEIPQRMMMQSFVYGFLSLLGVSNLDNYTILATAIIWCMGIGIQGLIAGKHFNKDMLYDIIASLVFSLGIGYVYQKTGLILITMVAHFFERILSNCIRIPSSRNLNQQLL